MKTLTTLLIVFFACASQAVCLQESPFPFPLNLSFFDVNQGRTLRGVDVEADLLFTFKGPNREAILYKIMNPSRRTLLTGLATRQAKAYCDNHGDSTVCLAADNGELIVEFNTPTRCEMHRFAAPQN